MVGKHDGPNISDCPELSFESNVIGVFGMGRLSISATKSLCDAHREHCMMSCPHLIDSNQGLYVEEEVGPPVMEEHDCVCLERNGRLRM